MINIFVFGANSDLIYELIIISDDNIHWHLYSKKIGELKNKINQISNKKKGSLFTLKKIDFSEKFLDTVIFDLKSSTIDKIILAQGLLVKNDLSPEKYSEFYQVNVISIMQIIQVSLKILKHQGYGKIIVFGSIAGDIGKNSNYLYGSSKGALGIFVEGLQKDKEYGKFITILKPGPIYTKMTNGYKSNFLWIDKVKAGKLIKEAINKNQKIIYIPRYWKIIIFILKILPNFLTKKL